ncbi:MAG TPA: Maf family protein [Vicinamibacterales bacterium]
MPLVLASASPRRTRLLQDAGIPHVVAPAAVDESVRPRETPAEHVRRLAEAKASAAAAQHPDALVLAADTVVVRDGTILGKPCDPAEARAMLRSLAGRSHEVHTGVAIAGEGRLLSAVELAEVRFAPMTDAEIDWYVSTGEPFDKAGAYAVQGLASRFVEAVSGAPSTVIGLPVVTVCRLLRQFEQGRRLLEAAGPAVPVR